MHVPLRARRGERNEVAEVGAGRLRELGGRWNNVAHQLFWHFFLTLQILLSLVLVPLKAENSL